MRVPIYNCRLSIGLGPDQARALSQLPARARAQAAAYTDWDGLTLDLGKGVFAVALTLPTTAGVIAHEAYHCLNYIRKYHEIDDSGNAEACAYLLQWLVQALTDAVKRRDNEPWRTETAHGAG